MASIDQHRAQHPLEDFASEHDASASSQRSRKRATGVPPVPLRVQSKLDSTGCERASGSRISSEADGAEGRLSALHTLGGTAGLSSSATE